MVGLLSDNFSFSWSQFFSVNFSIFEIFMLISFGMSWPISITKALKTKVVEGKSFLFIFVVGLGYFFGIIHKVCYSLDWVILLYIFNLVMVVIDISLYFHYKKKPSDKI